MDIKFKTQEMLCLTEQPECIYVYGLFYWSCLLFSLLNQILVTEIKCVQTLSVVWLMSGNGPVDNQNEQNWVNFVCIRVKLDKQKKFSRQNLRCGLWFTDCYLNTSAFFFQWHFLQNASYENSWLENFWGICRLQTEDKDLHFFP